MNIFTFSEYIIVGSNFRQVVVPVYTAHKQTTDRGVNKYDDITFPQLSLSLSLSFSLSVSHILSSGLSVALYIYIPTLTPLARTAIELALLRYPCSVH